MTPQQFVTMVQTVAERWPSAVLRRNSVGNLVVDVDGEYVAWLDLTDGEINSFDTLA